jgi:hypothetical protein
MNRTGGQFRLRVAESILLGVLCGTPATAQWLGTEFQVNSYSSSSPSYAAVAGAEDGSFVVVWHEYIDQDEGREVIGRRFDTNGSPTGLDFQVNTYTTGDQDYPAIAMRSNGEFVVVWSSHGQDGYGFGVFGQRFSSSGEPAGKEFLVNSTTSGNQGAPDVAMDEKGRYVVVWPGDSAASGEIYGQRFATNGAPVSGEFRINTYTSGTQLEPAVASWDTGHFLVTWTSFDQDEWGEGVFAQLFDDSGNPVGDEQQVNTFTPEAQKLPDAARLGEAEFVVVWHSAEQDGFGGGIVGRRIGADGSPVGDEMQVNTFTDADQTRPAIATESGGGIIVVWDDDTSDGLGRAVLAQRYGPSGDALGEEFDVNTGWLGDQQVAAVGARATGGFVVVWESAYLEGPDLFGQLLGPALFSDDFEVGTTCRWTASEGSASTCT